MNWIKKDIKTAQPASADPRIESPEIKVVYPSQAGATKEAEQATPTQVAAQAPAAPVQPVMQQAYETPQVIKTTAPETVTTTEPGATPVASKWTDTVKQNMGLFLICALISLGIGFFIGKKMKS